MGKVAYILIRKEGVSEEKINEKKAILDEITRSLKQLLIRELLRHRFIVFQNLGLKEGVDLVVADWVREDDKWALKTAGMDVKTASADNSGGYSFDIPPRSKYPADRNFLWALVFDQKDELKPSLYVLDSIQLKEYIDKNEKRSGWHEKGGAYTLHISKIQLKELEDFKGFKVINNLFGTLDRKRTKRRSHEYWEKINKREQL